MNFNEVKERRVNFNLAWSSSNSKSPTLNCLLTRSINPNESALIKLPVNTVINTAVLFGRSLKMLNLALPIKVPSLSPRADKIPPSKSKETIRTQPDTESELNKRS